MKTWHIESAVMASALIATVLISGGDSIEWIGAATVFLSTRHMSVADRMAEKEASKPFVLVIPCLEKGLSSMEANL